MTDKYNTLRFFLVLCIICQMALILDGCGFHLRGSLGDVAPLPPIYLQGTPGTAILVELKQTLQGIGTEIVSDKSLATYVLNIINEQKNRRILSVSSTGQVQEYELYYTVAFTVADPKGAILLENQNISFTRSYSYSETDLLAKSSEEESLAGSMRQDAVQAIIRRLQALTSQPPVSPPVPPSGSVNQAPPSQSQSPAPVNESPVPENK